MNPARWPAALATALLAALLLALFRAAGPLLIDDAWISFRYAAHLAGGDGLVFNPGDRVQGFTNPLYTLLLAAGALAGIEIPRLALGVGFAGALASASALVGQRPGPRAAVIGGAFAAALLLLPEFLLNCVSGLETALFCGLLTWSFVAFGRGWWRAAGVLQGLLLITRPDAVFWIAPGLLWLLARNRSALRRVLIPLGAIAVPWLIFAWLYYGSPVPHSIAAKRLIHAGEFGAIAQTYVNYFRASPATLVAATLALLSVVVAAPAQRGRRSKKVHPGDAPPARVALAVPLAATLLYLGGLCASGVQPFEVPRYFLWYAIPPLPVLFLVAAAGTIDAAGRFGSSRGMAAVGVAALVVVLLAGSAQLRLQSAELAAIRTHFERREGLYERTAAEIRRQAGDASVDVLVGEVGVLGYRLLGHRVHDSSGINSPEIRELRQAEWDDLAARGETRLPVLQDGSPRWVLRFLDAKRPEFITSLRLWVQVHRLEQDERFLARYEPVAVETVWLGRGPLQNTLWRRRGE